MLINKIEITDKTIFKVIFWVLLFIGIFYFKTILIVLFFAIILSSIVNRFVLVLNKAKIPRLISVTAFYILFIGFLFLIGYIFAPAIVRYLSSLFSSLPALLHSFRVYNVESSAWYSNLLSYLINYFNSLDINIIATSVRNWIFASSSSVISTIAYILLAFIISFYLSMKENGLRNFLRLISHSKYEEYVSSLFERVERKISSWFLGQMLVAFIVGIIIFIILVLFKIPFALPIALLAFIFELLPMLGTTMSAIPAVFFAWNMGGVTLSLLVLASFFIVSQISSYFLYPKIVGKFVDIPTVVIIIALFIGVEVGGFWGALISIPLSTILMELFSDLKKRKLERLADISSE